jgi:hypothetical protein
MIFEAIAVGKVALDALQTVRGLLEEGKGIAEAGRDLGKFFDAKEQIEGRISSGKAGDEEFWELEKIRAAEKQFFEQMDWYGRAGLKDDYLRWQNTRKELKEKERKREEAKRLAKKKAIQNGFLYTAVGIAVLGVVGGAVALLLWLISLRGR